MFRYHVTENSERGIRLRRNPAAARHMRDTIADYCERCLREGNDEVFGDLDHSGGRCACLRFCRRAGASAQPEDLLRRRRLLRHAITRAGPPAANATIPSKFTAAHRTLPFGTRLRVTDAKTHRSVVVIVNDRGPFTKGRVLDLSLAAAKALHMPDRGLIRVTAAVE